MKYIFSLNKLDDVDRLFGIVIELKKRILIDIIAFGRLLEFGVKLWP